MRTLISRKTSTQATTLDTTAGRATGKPRRTTFQTARGEMVLNRFLTALLRSLASAAA
jgi:hypothetical protein